MDLGQKLRQARLEAGLSQRQLCGDVITRNMLSQIENGSARPSMDTLRYLAGKLGKNVSFFLDEQAVSSPNSSCMDSARAAFDAGDFAGTLEQLRAFREPDPVYARERALMVCTADLALAEQALADGRALYALELLEAGAAAARESGFASFFERQRLLLLGRAVNRGLGDICRQLPSCDDELLLRARGAAEEANFSRAAVLLEAAEDHSSPQWNLLRGKVCLAMENYADAAEYLRRAEDAFPETRPLLEQCYREMGDYKLAYEYACKQKK